MIRVCEINGACRIYRVYMRDNKYNMAEKLKERDCLEDLAVDLT